MNGRHRPDGYRGFAVSPYLACGGLGGRCRLRGVLELLLGAEQPVEHRLAKVLAERDRDRGADQRHERDLPPRAATPLAAQVLRGVAQRFRRRTEIALDLLVLGQGPYGPLSVGHALVGVAGSVEGLLDAVPQVFVLDHASYVRVRTRGPRGLARLVGLRASCCHSPQSPRPLALSRSIYP